MRNRALEYVRANSGLLFRPDSTCVLWLPGQDDAYSSTIRDRSGKGNNGTIYGVTWTRLPRGLWVLPLDGGDDYVDCGRDSSLDMGTGDFSLECWFKTTADDTTQMLINKGSLTANATTGARYMLSILGTTNKLEVQLDDNTTKTTILGAATVNDGAYHYTMFTADRSGNGQIYLDGATDGAAVAITGSNLSLDDTSKDLCIGVLSDDETSDNFAGIIALVRAYKGLVLPASVGLNHYNQERHLFNV